MTEHSSFMPHGICYLWKPELVWLHVLSDASIALAYYAIPPALVYLVVRARREARALGLPRPARGLPYEWVYLAFGLFIVACGTTHLLSVWNVWHPNYWLSGGVKVVTAMASIATAIALPPLMPKAVALFREARISELQHTQLSLLAAVVEHSDDAIMTDDLTGIVTSWNRGAEVLYGYTAEEMIGRTLAPLLPPKRRHELLDLRGRVAKGESITHYETERVTKDGRTIHVALTISPMWSQSGEIVGAAAIARDMTERRRAAEQELRLAQEQAARAHAEQVAEDLAAMNRTKSEFLAVMSHELRTPLNAILGYTDLVDSELFGPVTEAQREQFERIKRSVNHLRALIEQILVYTQLEAGRAEPEQAPIDIAQIAREAAEMIAAIAASKNIGLRVEVQPLQARTDPVYLKQILLNLLSNAVKFTDAGEVSVALTEDAKAYRIDISDTGPGIQPELHEQIFEPFWQAEQGRTRSYEGTGLGLTIARRLARVLGGNITLASEVGKGSTFSVVLPKNL